MADTVTFTVKDQVGTLLIDRPEARNALNWQAQRLFADAVKRAADSDLRALIITAAGDTFVAGGDIKEQVDRYDAETAAQLRDIMGAALRQLRRLPFPVIAAINGNSYGGGCELITACDLRLMASDAHLQFVQARMGLTTGWGGAARLVELIGVGHALDLLLTARQLSAGEAQQIGLVQRVVPADQDTYSAALAWARQICQLPPAALGRIKQLVYRSTDRDSGYAAEAELFITQWQHPEHIEAVTAFIAKRRPNF